MSTGKDRPVKGPVHSWERLVAAADQGIDEEAAGEMRIEEGNEEVAGGSDERDKWRGAGGLW